jgi:hypothetical protein
MPYPRHVTLKRILSGMGVTFAALHRAQELVENPMGEVTEPIAPDFTPEEAHQAAVRLARKAGKAVAHCCLSFMEMGAHGWHLSSSAGNGTGRAHADRLVAGKRREVAALREDRPDA